MQAPAIEKGKETDIKFKS